MSEPLIGSEAIAGGLLTRGQLRARYAAVHPGVYLPKGAEHTLAVRALAAWLWTGRRGVIAGRAAAALHDAKWVDATTPIEIIAEHGRRQPGVIVREETIGDDEVIHIGEVPVTSPARTAFDLARRLPRNAAVVHLDSLAAATGVTAADTAPLAQRYRGARGVRSADAALDLRRFILHRVREAFARRGWNPPTSTSGSLSAPRHDPGVELG